MRGSFPLMAWLSKSEGSFLRWLSAGGFFLCLYVAGLLTYSGPFLLPHFFKLSPYPGIWSAFLTTLTQAFLAGLLVVCVNIGVLCLAACSGKLRFAIEKLSALLSDIPALGGVCLLLAVLPTFWAIVAIAAFSLSVRTLQAVLSVEKTIPASYHKTAQTLRLGVWHRFWKIHLPLSVPKLTQTILDDMPDFWVRLLGAQAISVLMYPHIITGCGAYALHALIMSENATFFLTFFYMMAVIILGYQAFIKPLRRRSQRYEIDPILPSIWGDEESYSYKTLSSIVVLLVAGVLFTALLVFLFPLKIFFAYAVIEYVTFFVSVFSISIALSAVIKLLISSRKNLHKNEHAYNAGLFVFPLFAFLIPVIHSFVLCVLCLSIAFQSILGFMVFSSTKEKQRKRFYKTAQHLRLPTSSFLWHVQIPLIFPSLSQGGTAALFPIWNIIYLIGTLSPFSFISISGHNPQWSAEISAIFLLVITFLSLITRHGMMDPLQRFLIRKYKVLS